jgi:hypothetical protein
MPRSRPDLSHPGTRIALCIVAVALALAGALVFDPSLVRPQTRDHVASSVSATFDPDPTPLPSAVERRTASADAVTTVTACDGPADEHMPPSQDCDAGTPAVDEHIEEIELPSWNDPEVPAEEPAGSGDGQQIDVSMQRFVWPVAGAITSLFGPAHPLGIDIATDAGRGVGAIADGRVAVSSYDTGYGYFVLINHAGGLSTLYAHFMTAPEVQTGQTVQRGQIIGYAGTTGRSTGPHLHLEVRQFGTLVDPVTVLPAMQLVIDPIAYRAPAVEPSVCPDSGAIPLQAPAGMEWLCPEPSPSPSPSPSPFPSPSPSPEPVSEEPAQAESADEAMLSPPIHDATPASAEVEISSAAQKAAAPAQPVASPSPRPSATPSPSPSPTPRPTPAPTPTPPATPSPTATPLPTPSPTSSPRPREDFLGGQGAERPPTIPQSEAGPTPAVAADPRAPGIDISPPDGSTGPSAVMPLTPEPPPQDSTGGGVYEPPGR